MLETDAPYILPRDLAREERPPGGKNEPSTLAHVARVVADRRGESVETLARATTATAVRFFGLEPS